MHKSRPKKAKVNFSYLTIFSIFAFKCGMIIDKSKNLENKFFGGYPPLTLRALGGGGGSAGPQSPILAVIM